MKSAPFDMVAAGVQQESLHPRQAPLSCVRVSRLSFRFVSFSFRGGGPSREGSARVFSLLHRFDAYFYLPSSLIIPRVFWLNENVRGLCDHAVRNFQSAHCLSFLFFSLPLSLRSQVKIAARFQNPILQSLIPLSLVSSSDEKTPSSIETSTFDR